MGQRTSAARSQYASFNETAPRMGLPLDIILTLVEMFDHEALCVMSLVSKDMNRIVNRQLWKSVLITSGDEWEARKARRNLARSRKVVCRDPVRMLCIRRLRLNLYMPRSRLDSIVGRRMEKLSGRRTQKLADILCALPNLTELVIESCCADGERVAHMLNKVTFPFQLKKFACATDIHNLIGPFLKSQPRIEDYRIRELGYHLGSPDRGRPISTSPSEDDLPQLRRMSGPQDVVPYLLRRRSLESVEVATHHMDVAIGELYSTFYLFDQATRNAIVAGADATERIRTPNLSMDFLAFGGQHHIPVLISSVFLIALHPIRSLKIKGLELPSDGFARALKKFPALEYLEWQNSSYCDAKQRWTALFIKACAASAPTLRRITIGVGSGDNHVWTRTSITTLGALERIYTPPLKAAKESESAVSFENDDDDSSVAESDDSDDSDDSEDSGEFVGDSMLPICLGFRWVWRMQNVVCPSREEHDSTPWEIDL